MELLFQTCQSVLICFSQLHVVTVVIRVIFLIETQKPCGKIMVRIGLLFFGRCLRQFQHWKFRLHHRCFCARGKRPERLRPVKHGVSAGPVCLHIFQPCFAALIMPVVLRGSFPQRQHHLIDFLNTGRIGKLPGNFLNTLPIVRNSIGLIRPWIQFRGVYKETVDTSGKLPDFIACHCFTVFIREKSVLRHQNINALYNNAPFQLYFYIGLCQVAVAE